MLAMMFSGKLSVIAPSVHEIIACALISLIVVPFGIYKLRTPNFRTS